MSSGARRPALLVPALAALVPALGAPSALSSAFLPPRHEIFQGVAGQPISSYMQEAGKHPAVYEIFAAWGEYLPGIFKDAQAAHARLMIHITTASGRQEVITPQQIAEGQGLAWAAVGQLGGDRLLWEVPELRGPELVLPLLPRAAVRVRRVGAVGL